MVVNQLCISSLIHVTIGCICFPLQMAVILFTAARPTGHPGGAYEMINRLKQLNQNKILQQLANALSERERRKGNYIKFKDSFDAKPIYTTQFLLQKM